MAFNYTLPLRVIQGLFALIVLGLTAYGETIHKSPKHTKVAPLTTRFFVNQSRTGITMTPA